MNYISDGVGPVTTTRDGNRLGYDPVLYGTSMVSLTTDQTPWRWVYPHHTPDRRVITQIQSTGLSSVGIFSYGSPKVGL